MAPRRSVARQAGGRVVLENDMALVIGRAQLDVHSRTVMTSASSQMTDSTLLLVCTHATIRSCTPIAPDHSALVQYNSRQDRHVPLGPQGIEQSGSLRSSLRADPCDPVAHNAAQWQQPVAWRTPLLPCTHVAIAQPTTSLHMHLEGSA